MQAAAGDFLQRGEGAGVWPGTAAAAADAVLALVQGHVKQSNMADDVLLPLVSAAAAMAAGDGTTARRLMRCCAEAACEENAASLLAAAAAALAAEELGIHQHFSPPGGGSGCKPPSTTSAPPAAAAGSSVQNDHTSNTHHHTDGDTDDVSRQRLTALGDAVVSLLSRGASTSDSSLSSGGPSSFIAPPPSSSPSPPPRSTTPTIHAASLSMERQLRREAEAQQALLQEYEQTLDASDPEEAALWNAVQVARDAEEACWQNYERARHAFQQSPAAGAPAHIADAYWLAAAELKLCSSNVSLAVQRFEAHRHDRRRQQQLNHHLCPTNNEESRTSDNIQMFVCGSTSLTVPRRSSDITSRDAIEPETKPSSIMMTSETSSSSLSLCNLFQELGVQLEAAAAACSQEEAQRLVLPPKSLPSYRQPALPYVVQFRDSCGGVRVTGVPLEDTTDLDDASVVTGLPCEDTWNSGAKRSRGGGSTDSTATPPDHPSASGGARKRPKSMKVAVDSPQTATDPNGTKIAVIDGTSREGPDGRVLQYVYDCLASMEGVFTMKSKTYQAHLKAYLPKPSTDQQRYILNITKPPLIPTNAAEADVVDRLRRLDDTATPQKRLPETSYIRIADILEDFLTSIVNKAMFLLVVEYQTWYIHAPAREQLTDHLLEFVWPQRPTIQNNFRPFFLNFVEVRVRHFRDSVARHFRERAKHSIRDHPDEQAARPAPAVVPFTTTTATTTSDGPVRLLTNNRRRLAVAATGD